MRAGRDVFSLLLAAAGLGLTLSFHSGDVTLCEGRHGTLKADTYAIRLHGRFEHFLRAGCRRVVECSGDGLKHLAAH